MSESVDLMGGTFDTYDVVQTWRLAYSSLLEMLVCWGGWEEGKKERSRDWISDGSSLLFFHDAWLGNMASRINPSSNPF